MSSSVLLKGAVYDQKVVLKVLLDREAQRPSPKMTEKLIRAICSTWFHSPPEEMIKVVIWDTNSKACLPPSIPAQSLWPNRLCKRECNVRSMYYRTCWTPISHFLYRQYVDNIDDKKSVLRFLSNMFWNDWKRKLQIHGRLTSLGAWYWLLFQSNYCSSSWFSFLKLLCYENVWLWWLRFVVVGTAQQMVGQPRHSTQKAAI